MNIAALVGIVTYNPDIERLNDNIKAIILQIENVIIVDNGSNNINMIHKCIDPYKDKIKIITFNKNKGIASALRKIMEYANMKKFEWVMTLDQDSIIESGLVSAYYKAALDINNSQVGMFTCLIKDRNFVDEKYEKQNTEYMDVPYCITSASFTNVAKYFETPGYDPAFFIDCVDFDICYLLKEAGFKITRINYVGLYHEVGHGENRYFFWKKIVVYHQIPLRIYYLTRNTIWMHKKHKKKFSKKLMLKKLISVFLKIVLYEDNKNTKLRSFVRGIKDSNLGGFISNEN